MVNFHISDVTSHIETNVVHPRILIHIGVKCALCQRMIKFRHDYAEIFTVTRVTIHDMLLGNIFEFAKRDPSKNFRLETDALQAKEIKNNFSLPYS